jgi:hypothetical protein
MSVLPAQFDASLLSFGELKSLQSGAKSVDVKYDGRPLMMQVGSLDLPYGLNEDDKFGPVKYSVNVSLRDYDSVPKVKAIFTALESMDTRVMGECVEKNWLRKPGMTTQILKQMKLYKPSVKFSEDENGNRKPYPPTVKVNLRKSKDGQFETAFYDSDKKQINTKDIPLKDIIVRKTQATLLIECTGVWISSVGCGLSWKAKQMRIDSTPDLGRGYGFIDEDGSAPAPRAAAPAARSASAAPVSKSSGFAAAFEDDEEELDESEVLSSQAPPPQAQVVAAPPAEDNAAVQLPKKTIVKKKIVAGGKA